MISLLVRVCIYIYIYIYIFPVAIATLAPKVPKNLEPGNQGCQLALH